jgi:hypothetical protein
MQRQEVIDWIENDEESPYNLRFSEIVGEREPRVSPGLVVTEAIGGYYADRNQTTMTQPMFMLKRGDGQ